MLLLTSTSDLVQVITGAAGAIAVHASYVDNNAGTITPGRTNTASIATAATTTVVASPAASTQRNVKLLNIFNSHASISNLVTLQHTDGTNVEILWRGTLKPGESASLNEAGDVVYTNAQGVEVVATGNQNLLAANSASTVAAGYAADTYLAGSGIALPSGVNVAGVQVKWTFDMVKTAAGTAAPTINIRFGTAGTIADASVCALAFAVGTAAVDTGKFEVTAVFRSAGSGTTAVVAAVASCQHSLAATGLTTTGASGYGQIATIGAGFNSAVNASIIGLSFNGGASFAGTCNVVATQLTNYQG
jgi:hypothetical protein